jgi:uncharacterized membrane protein YkvA (DUF1232 family)
MKVEGNKFFESAKQRATNLIKDNDNFKQLFNNAGDKLAELNIRKLKSTTFAKRISVIMRMIRAYAKGAYRDVQTQNIVLMVAAVIYFVTPLDLIPDFIPITGFIDDFTVVLWVYNRVQLEIDKFEAWENGFENG